MRGGAVSGFLVVALSLLLAWGTSSVGPAVRGASTSLPSQISDKEFWGLVTGFSEPGGFFRSDNLVSNETAFQSVVPELRRRVSPGGAYLGVGPDQNFTYIAALQPRIAFVVDIRRQNMLLHLLYKALIERSSDRAEFLSRLFSKPRPSGLGDTSSAERLFEAYELSQPNEALYRRNLREATTWLTRHHKFPLTPADIAGIGYAYRAFFAAGPDLRYSFPQGFGGRWFPSYAELMQETDDEGENHSYLASEANFTTLKRLQQRNLLIPVVGGFGGDNALQAVGRRQGHAAHRVIADDLRDL